MISNIFGKTKPINFIIIITFLFLFYWAAQFFMFDLEKGTVKLGPQLLFVSLLLLSIFIVDFIIKRNKLTDTNSYAILFYASLIVLFPETLLDANAIVCSMFLLFATRRLISIRSLKNIKMKVFDATIWIMVSSIFYDWALLYVFLVFAAIYTYEPKNIRNWLVPFAAIFASFMTAYAILVVTGNTDFIGTHYALQFKFDKTYFLNLADSTKLVLYVVLIGALCAYAFLKLGKVGLGKIVTMRLIALSFLVGLVVKIVTKSTEDHPIMITFFPAVIFLTSAVESIAKPKIKELILIATILIPILALLVGSMVR